MKQSISIFWFRQDLRLSDNPGLIEASRLGGVLPIYILDDLAPPRFKTGSASKIYLHHSLLSLNQSLNNNLNLYIGNPKEIIFQLIKKYSIRNVFWNRCYEPWYRDNDKIIEKAFVDFNINYNVFNGSYLWLPEKIKKEDGSHYKVFWGF